jgi:glycosyltransferase involved in cell wall biosynthesis
VTTLITTVQGIGLGIMGQALAEHVPQITRILGVRRNPSLSIDLKFPKHCELAVYDREIPVSATTGQEKFVYIEQSYGLSQHLRYGTKLVFVPMWEQGPTAAEALLATEIVCVTKHTRTVIEKIRPYAGVYLPWPIDTELLKPTRPPSLEAKTILHNAGSLGGNQRKGTAEAIQIFQRSGLAQEGVRLIVHAWVPPPPDLAKLISRDDTGIVWTNRFLPRPEDIYTTYDPDLLLMPSKIEGHALVALEAMARGVPCVITDSPPINEYEVDSSFLLPVDHYAISPLAAPYAMVDVEAGAERLWQACATDLAAKSHAVREFVEREMSWKILGPRWEALLEEG